MGRWKRREGGVHCTAERLAAVTGQGIGALRKQVADPGKLGRRMAVGARRRLAVAALCRELHVGIGAGRATAIVRRHAGGVIHLRARCRPEKQT